MDRTFRKLILILITVFSIAGKGFCQFEKHEVPLKIGVGSYFVEKGYNTDENHFTFSIGKEWSLKKRSLLISDLGFITNRNLINGTKYDALASGWIILDFAYAYKFSLSPDLQIKPMIGEAWMPLDNEDGFVDYLIDSIHFFVGSDFQLNKKMKKYGLSFKWYATTFVPTEGLYNYSIKFYVIYPF